MFSELFPLIFAMSFAPTIAYPEHFACSRKVQVGQPIMGAEFRGDSTAVSIRLDKVDCGGVLTINTDYAPVISGIPMNIFLSGFSVDSCILDRGGSPTPNWIYLIDVTDKDYNPFPGANFTQGAHIWDGTGTVSGSKVCPARSTGFKSIPGPPHAIVTPPILRFSKPGEATIRIAWSHGPFKGVYIVENCTYKVSAPFCSNPAVCLEPASESAVHAGRTGNYRQVSLA